MTLQITIHKESNGAIIVKVDGRSESFLNTAADYKACLEANEYAAGIIKNYLLVDRAEAMTRRGSGT